MAVNPTKIAGVADSGDPSKIQPSDINPIGAPATPTQGSHYIEYVGTSPNRFIRFYLYDQGAWWKCWEVQH